jgi:hypothetical protein
MSFSSHQARGGRCAPPPPRQAPKALVGAAVVAALVATTSSPAFGSDSETRVGFDLRLSPPSPLLLARRAKQRKAPAVPAAAPPASEPARAASEVGGADLGFDLLGPGEKPTAVASVDDESPSLRRKMLTYHPLLGIGLLVCETATVVLGQLNYSDRFGGGPSSARYELSHKVLAWSTSALFVGTGMLALLAPSPSGKQHQGFDRVLLHKLGMFTAAAGMVAQIALGVYTASREGYQNQESLARAHLAIGYVTLGATYVGVGGIVF